jgi:hypothetical protein
MPRPLLQRMNRIIQENGGDEWVFARLAEGEAIRDIVKDLGCSRPYFYMWLREKGHGDQRKAMYEEAKLLSAAAKEEEGQEILDNLEGRVLLAAPEVTLAVARSNYRKWQASVRDRATYGDKGQTEVNISIGSLHLDALRSRAPQQVVGVPVQAPARKQLLQEVMPAEVVE